MTKPQIIRELEKLEVEVPEGANLKELKKLLADNKPEAESEDGEDEGPKGKMVTLYDTNEKQIQIRASEVKRYLANGYREKLGKPVNPKFNREKGV